MTNRHFIPNKFTWGVLAFIILGLGIYGLYYVKYTKKTEPQKEIQQDKKIKVQLVNETKESKFYLDTDNDGAYDWVEELYPELDPTNPDSDNDGVLDGRYIERLKQIKERDESREKTPIKKLTESEKIGRGIYTSLLFLEQSGNTIDQKTKDQMAINVENRIKTLPLSGKKYIRNELNLVSDTKENSYAYKKNIQQFFEKYKVNTRDIELIIKATEKPENYKTELEAAAVKYEEYVNLLIEMKVPFLIAGRHNQLVNTVNQIGGALRNLTKNESDDIVALSSLVQIQQTMESFLEAGFYIQKYFEIIDEPGIFDDTPKSPLIPEQA